MEPEKSILELVGEEMTNMVKNAKNSLSTLQKDQKNLDKVKTDSELIFQIRLRSLWAHEGEQSLSYTSPVPDILENTIKTACGNFRKINRRLDVQADVAVFVVLPNGTKIKLPESYWKHLADKYTKAE